MRQRPRSAGMAMKEYLSEDEVVDLSDNLILVTVHYLMLLAALVVLVVAETRSPGFTVIPIGIPLAFAATALSMTISGLVIESFVNRMRRRANPTSPALAAAGPRRSAHR